MLRLTLLFGGLPVATLAAAWYAMRPLGPVVGAWRLAAVRSAVVVGAGATVGAEVLSAAGLLTPTGCRVAWLVALAGAVAGAVVRYRRGAATEQGSASTWTRPGWVEWLVIAALGAVAVGTLVVALAAEPNNWDSQAYHLPKVEQWTANRSVELYPASYLLQGALAPGAEYLLLHLRLLTGGDRLYNLVQWGGGVLCAVAASRVAAQLGAGRLGQLVTALTVGTAPMVVLEATSTQNDLVAAGWCACVATLVIDAAWSRLRMVDLLLMGSATGLAMFTKSTGMVAAGLLMTMWFVVRAWRVRSVRSATRLAGAALGVAAIVLVVNGPFLTRMIVTFGNPLGPPDVRGHALARHDPLAVTVNAARLLQTAIMVPDDSVNAFTADAVKRLATVLGQDVNDPATTRDLPFPQVRYVGPDEDFASFPLQVVAVGVGLVWCLVWRRRDPRVAVYALTCLAVGIGFAATLRWQPFGNRLVLPGLAVAAPLTGLAADALARRFRAPAPRAVVAAGLAIVLAGAGAIGVNAILFGTPRGLYGPNSVLTTDPLHTRFNRVEAFLPDYEWAAAEIRASGARRVGLVQGPYWFEYPWWVMLRDRRIVQLVSDIPGHPPASPTSVDAIICGAPAPSSCASLIPPGWTVQAHQSVTLALPPAR
ncbi:hypothetical protein ACNTMW_18670 [Planosporangium sp. 12N6]|uniref:hypothetical protein n=1 Tax=Planosporangium spinosum TaxID=3402278 RepID=UPI003CE79F6F